MMQGVRTRASRPAILMLLAITLSLFSAVAAPPARAHGPEGVIDQQVDGGPSCDVTQFPAATPLDLLTTQRQTFTPSVGSLAAVDLCLTVNVGEVLPGVPAFTMNVVELGEDGERTVATKDFSFSGLPLLGSDTRLWHLDLAQAVDLQAGGSYAIELTAPRLVFQWRATCGSLIASCPAGSTDRYAAGAASVGGEANDFGFRTWAPSAANVTTTIEGPGLICPDAATLKDTAVTVANTGAIDVGPFDVALGLRDGGTDHALGTAAVAGLPVGGSVTLSGSDFTPSAPAAGASGPVELVAVADPAGVLVEANETDNRATHKTTRVPCGEGRLDNLRLVAGDGSPLPDVLAGIVDIPMTGLSPEAIAAGAAGFAGTSARPEDGAPTRTDPTDSDTLQSSPIKLSPIKLSPIKLSPIKLSPIHLSPIHLSPIKLSTFFGTVDPSVLDQVFLVGIPVQGTWEELIAAYPDQANVTNRAAAQAAADRLLAKAAQDRTLGDVLLRLNPPLDLRIDQVDLGAVMDLSLLGTTLSTQRIGTVPVPGGGSWCNFIADRSHLDCAANGINPATETFVSLDLRGFPMEQLDLTGVRIAQIGLRSDTILAGLPLADSIARPNGLPASTARIFRLSYTVLGARPVSQVLANPQSLLVCDGSITPNPCNGTVAAAEAAFAFRDNKTVADLVTGLTTQAAADFDVTNALLGVSSLIDLPWARFDTDPLDLDEMTQGTCPGIAYEVSADVVSQAPVADAVLSIVLPRGFDPKAGTATASIDGGPATAIADGTESIADGRVRVDLTVPGIAADKVTARIQACASTTLGIFTADSDAAWRTFDVSGAEPVLVERTVAPETSTSRRPERHADVRVLEREEPDGAATQRVAAPESLILRHIPTGDDEDIFRIPLGQELPNGLTLRAGDTVRVWLAPPAGAGASGSVADLDLTVYGPEQSPLVHTLIESTPVRDGDAPIIPVDDNAAQVDGASGSAPAQSVQDSPIHLSPIKLSPIHLSPIKLSSPRVVSNQRGDRGEYAELDIRPGDSGEIAIRVSSYLGDADDRHYTLFYEVARPQASDVLATCASPGDFNAATVTGQLPIVPAGTRTLILVNQTLTATRHGSAETSSMMTRLQALAAHDQVRGVVVPIERDAGVAARYQTWRGGGWCDPVAANRVVAEIRRFVVGKAAAVPTIEHVVLVGGDDLLPMARVPDMVQLGNESQYLGDVLAATQRNNPLVAAYAAGTTMTDDPFGTLRPIAWRDQALFVPELGVGRLVETPSDVRLAVDQFLATNGLLDADTALAAGYDFNADGAADAADGLASLGAAVDDEFVDGGWSRNALTQRLSSADPDLATINAHTNHYALLSAAGDATGAASEVLTTAQVRANGTPLGRVAFTIGCHYGTSVPDRYASTGPDVIDVDGETDDWAQLMAQRTGVLVANTGFGYGTDEAVAYSERLMADFAHQTARTGTVGEAFTAAKQQYLAGVATPGELDAKTLQQAVLYGLPMYRFHDTPPVTDNVPSPTVTVDPVTGLSVVSVDTGALHVGAEGSCTNCLQQIDTAYGTYFDLVGPAKEGDPLAVQGRAIVPQYTQRFRLPGVEVGGFVPSAITSIDVSGGAGVQAFDPVIVRANLADGDAERPAEILDQAGPGTNAHVRSFGDEVFMTVPLGAFRGASIAADGEVRGQYRLDTRLAGTLYLRNTAASTVDRVAPEITDLRVGRRVVSGGDTIVVRVDAKDDTGIARGVAALRVGGTWRFVELVVPAGGPTTASLLGAVQVSSGAAVDTVQYWVVDKNGNVGFGTNKSLRPDVRTMTETATPWGTDPVVSIAGPRSNGWYVGPVTVTVVSGSSSVYHVTIDGQVVESIGVGQSVTVSGTGSYTVRVVADDDPSKVTEVTIMIDATAPVGVFHTPNSSAGPEARTYVAGAVVPIDLRCHDAISGVATCKANDSDGLLNTATVGTFTLTGQVIDRAGNVSNVAVEYHVVSRYRFDGFFTPVMDDRITVSAGNTVPFKFRVYEGDTEITDIKIVKSATWQKVTCEGAPLGSAFAAQSQPRLRYTDGQLIFNAITSSTWQSGECYQFRITLPDGSSKTAIATVG